MVQLATTKFICSRRSVEKYAVAVLTNNTMSLTFSSQKPEKKHYFPEIEVTSILFDGWRRKNELTLTGVSQARGHHLVDFCVQITPI